MTDIYIAYAREDRERVRPLAESLQFEGWDVWWDPSEPTTGNSAALDQKLGTAGAILVVWSSYSRGSEYVRSEAATGLYKNKLIQTRVDSASPPRPFDQLEVIDIGLWSGERDDPNWRRVMSAIRLFAGPPSGGMQVQPLRKPRSKPLYLEASRSVALGPLAAVAVAVLAGGGVWLADPFHWHTPAPANAETLAVVATSGSDEASGAEIETASMGVFEDTPEAKADWSAIDRDSPEGLRDFIDGYPKSSSAETARSLLRVLDAQAWVSAVTSDNEAAYSKYLRSFPASGAAPGAMSAPALERLSSLGAERTQAIEEIQRGLLALKLYKGAIDGKAGEGTNSAVRTFASNKKKPPPSLAAAAPRELRTFADLIASEVGAKAPAATPILASATTTVPSSTRDAAAADRERLAKAQAAAEEAEREGAADTIAVVELQRTADLEAWNEAQRLGTLASYQKYLGKYPAGVQAAAARAAVTRLSRPSAFSLDQLSSTVRVTVEAARRAQGMANTRATSARQIADSVQTAANIRNITGANGDRFETQISGGAPNGVGTKITGSGGSAGDRYRGELRAGKTAGLGVYDYADNPNNARASALRYEGEYANDAASGFGVTYWKNGDTFAGQQTGAPGTARGVLSFADGQKYEGEIRNGTRHGIGVVWSADGQVLMAGRWENGLLAEPATAEGPVSLSPPT